MALFTVSPRPNYGAERPAEHVLSVTEILPQLNLDSHSR